MAESEKTPVADSGSREEALSIPLYLAGLVVTLCGIQAVNGTIGDFNIALTTMLLTVFGFLFSFGCRWLEFRPRVIEIVCVGFIVYVLYAMVDQRMDWTFLVPATIDQIGDRWALYLVWFAVVRSWALTTDWQVLFCCVPAVAMLGLVATSSIDAIGIYFCLFLFAASFLLIHQYYLQNRRRASAQERTRPVEQLLLVQAGLAVLCGAILLLLGTLIVVPTRALVSDVPLSQAVRQMVGGKPAAQSAPSVSTQFSDEDNLDIGTGDAEWSASTEELLHVVVSDNSEHYWRGRTYDTYVGTGWESSLAAESTSLGSSGMTADDRGQSWAIPGLLTPGEAAPISGADLRAVFEVIGETPEFYYPCVPQTLIFATPQVNPPRCYADGRIDLGGSALAPHSRYEVIAAPTLDPMLPEDQARLRRAPTHYPLAIRRLYGHLRSGDNDVTVDEDFDYFTATAHAIVAGLPPGRRNPFDEAAAIRDWVSGRCVYSLTVAPIDSSLDHVHAFLAKTRRGYCDLFASSMAVLCRAQGIPARIATGFAPGARDATGFSLRAMDKHAWVEVYFPRYGWIPFDPTEGSRTDGTTPSPRAAASSLLQRWWAVLTGNGPIPEILLAAIILLLAYVLKTEGFDRLREWLQRRALRDGPAEPVSRTDIGRQYQQMARAMGRLGLARRPAETPLEYAARATGFLTVQEQVLGIALPAATVPALTAQFMTARYGGAAAPPKDLTAEVRQLADALARARRIRLWHRLWRKK